MGSPLEPVEYQRDLGLSVRQNLNWTENCQIRSIKAMKALFQIKRNLTSTCHWKVKKNAYTGLVVPIATTASQRLWRSKGKLQELKKVQHFVTKWIVRSNVNYRNRLFSLRILPLSLYLEMHDLLFLLSLRKDDHHIEGTFVKNDSLGNTRQSKRGEYKLFKSKLLKTNNIFSDERKFSSTTNQERNLISATNLKKKPAENLLAFLQKTTLRGKQMHLENKILGKL